MAALNEVQIMQNPALGAVLVWRFVCGYCPATESSVGAPFHLAFLALPLILHEKTRAGIESTHKGSGLRYFETKFADEKDRVSAVHERAMVLRDLSLRSVRLGIATGLLTLDPSSGVLWPRSRSTPPASIIAPIKRLADSGEKLGLWARQLSLPEIVGILKVDL